MTTKTPVEKIISLAIQRVADDLQSTHDYAQRAYGTQSPIEAILLTAIYSVARYGDEDGRAHSFDRLLIKGDEGEDSDWLNTKAFGVGPFLWLETQAPVGKYRADFLIHAPRGGLGFATLVVECDGHDFHERTKKQAAHDRSRDRAMQEAGHTVFRFTGSEIYRDPIKCARQVIAWADKATFG